MDVRQLQVLRELGELGSVKAVAEAMMVTPSAVSQQLTLLQRSAGVPLTRKDGRNLVLTDAGRVLADAGGAVIRAMADAHAAIGGYHDDPAGTVSVSAFHSAGQAIFGRLAGRLAATAEDDGGTGAGGSDDGGTGAGGSDDGGTGDGGTGAGGSDDGGTGDGGSDGGGSGTGAVPRLRLADEDVPQQGFPALTARYDIVLAHRMAHSEDWPTDRILVLPLAEEPFDVALPAGHPLAAKNSLSPSDVAGESWVSSRPGYSPADVLAAVAAVASRAPHIAHRVNDYATVAAVVAGSGVLGLLPRHTAAAAALSQGVVLRPLEGIATRRRIDMLIRPENARRQAVQRVAQLLREVVDELVSSPG
ncbi:LysR family transcriptional regulator [Arthrobacter cupressi]|uniref:Regulatory helix-turn-helix protein, lysR family n=1 Tax=Arthrobacter cupressi TaxID=1045773 RepID=A0A1G8J770_9MICC|nr:LysR family transcriptional regulator [Arthrobacter cupressi]NYD79253.1 DNA-binding transcriptional LysR family regulator [Arthrobacter cupressi]SDI26932.1 regulatory helix-turn-helix protein, lysR family [Arthrobacter cupressi]